MSLIIRKHDFQSSDYGNALFILHITHSLGNYTLKPGGTLRLLEGNFQDIAFKGVMSIVTRNNIRENTLDK